MGLPWSSQVSSLEEESDDVGLLALILHLILAWNQWKYLRFFFFVGNDIDGGISFSLPLIYHCVDYKCENEKQWKYIQSTKQEAQITLNWLNEDRHKKFIWFNIGTAYIHEPTVN